jgi:hypothetical protein
VSSLTASCGILILKSETLGVSLLGKWHIGKLEVASLLAIIHPETLVLVLHSLCNLCVPQPRDSLGNTNIVCLERVQGETKSDGTDAQSPHGNGADKGNARLGEVVDDA